MKEKRIVEIDVDIYSATTQKGNNDKKYLDKHQGSCRETEWHDSELVNFAVESEPEELPDRIQNGNMEIGVLQVYWSSPLSGTNHTDHAPWSLHFEMRADIELVEST